MNKRGITWEQIVKAAIALIVLVSLIAIFYYVLKPVVNNILGIEDESDKQGQSVMDKLAEIFGRKCNEGESKCDAITGMNKRCENGKWIITEEKCT